MSTETPSAPATAAPAGTTGRSRRRAPGVRRELAAFCLTALLTLLVVSAGTIWLSERIARTNALAEAERAAERLGEMLVTPVLTEALAGVPDRWEELDRDVRNRMSDGSVTKMVVWRADGRILYASDPQLIGQVLPPSDELRAAIAGETVSSVDEAPETATGADGALLEVYAPLRVPGEELAFEAYFAYAGIDRQAALLRGEIIPMAIGALVLLQVVQIPIAVSLARRVRRQQAERAALMQRTVEASERERRAIAADVHDGPVQDLAGVSYALSALRGALPEDRQPTVDKLVGAVRHAVQSLRRLMVDIYPPDLSGPGLGAAISDAAEPLRTEGVTVLMDAAPLPDMTPDAAATLYRTAKEALANVAQHAGATHTWITLEGTDLLDSGPAVRLEIADDGVGFPAGGTDRRHEGHLGLSLLRDRIVDLGGTMTLGERSGGGALLTAVVPPSHGQ
ncbi:sensor histidine kinase [Geodermatophilus sabuli]|uniref:Signal transduction histidine kinase n=1 Tax=Geodermatophilus sabuli TaxID=1564158 RepID=A0A285EFT7_9ACTN|nr:ATP-binding protein [Geodermatophilus sabuli]MBB3082992.1 signal transduction histidine kinase [Geodermatophilus sabuli]SNX97989.1 Signal transduction histidine kinase [Geodermatophilus sabuli]